MRARLLYVNTHVGQALREGGVKAAVEKYDPDLVVLVEVGRMSAQILTRRQFPITKWSMTGALPRRPVAVESGTIILAKRSVLKRKWWSNRMLSKQRWVNGNRDKWHPPRRLTRAFFVFRAKPSLRVHVGADHAWTHAGFPLHGDADVPVEFRKQIQAYAIDAGHSVNQGAATVHVGDMNSGGADGDFVEETFWHHGGLRLLLRRGLDFLLGHKVTVLDHEWIPADVMHTDHPSLVVDLDVK